jgi:hypothetical protein
MVEGKARSFNIQTNMNLIAQKVRELGDAALLIIDPVTAYFGSEIGSHRITDVRAALLPLEQFAKEFDIAVLAITHPPKSPSTKALNFIAGSGAFTHAPRLTFMVIEDPEAPRRTLLLAVKNNLGPKALSLGHTIAPRFVGPGIVTSRIEWDGLPVSIAANEALEAWAEKKKAKAADEAEDFLRTNMTAGQSYAASDIRDKAIHAGIAWSLIFEAWSRPAPTKSAVSRGRCGIVANGS